MPGCSGTGLHSNSWSSAWPILSKLERRATPEARFVAEIHRIMGEIGFPQHQYAGHSFRIGAATAVALAGMEDSTIQLLGRWWSTAFLRYVRTPHDKLAALSPTLIWQENVGTRPSHHQHCCSQGPHDVLCVDARCNVFSINGYCLQQGW